MLGLRNFLGLILLSPHPHRVATAKKHGTHPELRAQVQTDQPKVFRGLDLPLNVSEVLHRSFLGEPLFVGSHWARVGATFLVDNRCDQYAGAQRGCSDRWILRGPFTPANICVWLHVMRKYHLTLTINDMMNIPEGEVLADWLHQISGRRVADRTSMYGASVMLYHTAAAKAQSFGWHTDSVDAFLVAVSGSKRYRVGSKSWKETSEGIHAVDASFEAGDAVYIPRNFWHDSVSEHRLFPT